MAGGHFGDFREGSLAFHGQMLVFFVHQSDDSGRFAGHVCLQIMQTAVESFEIRSSRGEVESIAVWWCVDGWAGERDERELFVFEMRYSVR